MSAPEDDRDHHHPAPMSDVEVRARALEELLREKGLVDEGFIDAVVSAYANDIGPMNGARVVARAWVDAEYKKRLLADATAAIAELGYGGPQGEHMAVPLHAGLADRLRISGSSSPPAMFGAGKCPVADGIPRD